MANKKPKITITTSDVSRILDRSPMMIRNYRVKHGMPHQIIPGGIKHPVRFDCAAVVSWAERRGLKINKKALHKVVLANQNFSKAAA